MTLCPSVRFQLGLLVEDLRYLINITHVVRTLGHGADATAIAAAHAILNAVANTISNANGNAS